MAQKASERLAARAEVEQTRESRSSSIRSRGVDRAPQRLARASPSAPRASRSADSRVPKRERRADRERAPERAAAARRRATRRRRGTRPRQPPAGSSRGAGGRSPDRSEEGSSVDHADHVASLDPARGGNAGRRGRRTSLGGRKVLRGLEDLLDPRRARQHRAVRAGEVPPAPRHPLGSCRRASSRPQAASRPVPCHAASGGSPPAGARLRAVPHRRAPPRSSRARAAARCRRTARGSRPRAGRGRSDPGSAAAGAARASAGTRARARPPESRSAAAGSERRTASFTTQTALSHPSAKGRRDSTVSPGNCARSRRARPSSTTTSALQIGTGGD